ncbi:hypothetical protein D8674_014958 [Pyrus ussuriensis x Pyrus communis]|uniref:Uncharacterized protein n=1 Tax=Pyrus ussuriensis x Pyrus communis TaxID=2448454 RepID=A0A5N5GU02_9ROSA|nr:hypothetical protein D8674_014958 [Pyrus ussuriensis x Pyrus communis]
MKYFAGGRGGGYGVGCMGKVEVRVRKGMTPRRVLEPILLHIFNPGRSFSGAQSPGRVPPPTPPEQQSTFAVVGAMQLIR